ncbi:hypothetical protein BAE29_06250 [Acidithiobacillus caldus]|nr:hypothetical protein BAE29_06250 [Acidithiobacillus caldus]
MDVQEDIDPHLSAWQDDLSQTLIDAFPGKLLSVQVCTPALWGAAIHEGFDLRNMFGLITTVAPQDESGSGMDSTFAALCLY